LFKRRNNEVTGIYEVAKDDLVRAKEIFKEYFNLKRREF
jgi:hypothetical protein